MIQYKKLMMTLALLIMAVTGAWAQSTYTVTFAANGNTKTVENVTLPKTFQCNYDKANGELDLILKELYSWTGNANQTFCDGETTPTSSDENKVVAGSDNGDHYITINNVFEGTVTITGYYVVNSVVMETPYSLEISIAATAPAEWPLTSQDGKQWTLAEMPASDVELQVEYYDPILTLAANNSEWGKFEVTYAGEIDGSKLTLIEATKGLYGDIPENLFDGETNTKWCCETSNGCYIEFYTENAIEVVGYILTTANDNEGWPGRNPKNWVLKGKLNENGEWETIATVSNDTKMKDVNFTPYQFDADKPGSYKYFRLEIKETTGSDVLQLSEFTLLKKSSLPDITFNEGKYSIIPGAEVTIKAIPAEGYHFDAWSNNEEGYEVGKLRLIIDEDKEITAIFAENEYNITFAEGTNPDEWTATPNPAKTKQTVTVTYTGSKKVIGVKAEKKAAAKPVTLATALEDGAIIKVNFKWEGNISGDYVQGVYNAASGTFTVSKGGSAWGSQGVAVYKVEKSGDNIIIGAGLFDYNMEAMVWTFNTTNDTYTTTNSGLPNEYPEDFGLLSVTLNGTDITSQLTKQ